MNGFLFNREYDGPNTKYSPVGVIACDDRATILRADLTALTGKSFGEENILGKTWFDRSWRFLRQDGAGLVRNEHPVSRALESGKARREALTWVYGPEAADRLNILMDVFPFPGEKDCLETLIVVLTDLDGHAEYEDGLEGELISCREDVRTLLEASRESTMIVDREGKVLAVSRVGAEELGYGRDDLVGRNIDDVYPAVLAQKTRKHLREAFEQRRAVRVAENYGGRSFEVGIMPMVDYRQKVVKAALVSRGVTEFVDLEISPEKNRTGLDRIQDMARVGGWTWDIGSNQVSWSRTMCRLLEVNSEDLGDTYEAFMCLIHPDDKSLVMNVLGDSLSEEKHFELDHRLITPDGHELYVRTTAEIHHNQAGEPVQVVGMVQDITARKLAEQRVTDNEALMRAIVETAVEGIITINEAGAIESFNSAASKIFGYRVDEIVGRNVKILMPAPHRDRHDQYLAKYLASGEKKLIGIGRELEGLHKNGALVPIDLAVSEVVLKDRRIFTGIIRDVSERKNAERELRIKESAIQSSINAIIFCDFEGLITFVNRASLNMWEYDNIDDMVGQPVVSLFEERDRVGYCLKSVREEWEWFGELTAAKKNCRPFDVQVSGSMVTDEAGRPIKVMLSMVDITEQKAAEKQLRIQALFDKLTGLYNRRRLMELLEKEVSAARRHGVPLCLAMADLDHFKRINDRYGHRAGDDVLAGFGQLIQNELRAEDIAGRYGGEEFVFIMPHTTIEAAVVVLERIRTKLEKIVFKSNRERYGVTASIGAVRFDPVRMSEMELLDMADQALYKAKRAGRNRIEVYETN